MLLDRLLKAGSSLFPRFQRASRRRARRPAKVVPVIAGIPGSDVWFLRFALAFLAHLGQGGHVTDRLRNRVVGRPGGRPFNFDHLAGGPLLWAPNLVRSGHLFIGHTVCPGFSRIAERVPWWQDTRFCAPGYDYFHDGLDYRQVPVDMAPHAYVAVPANGLDAAAWTEPAQRAVLLYPDPVEQAAFYFRYCRDHRMPAYNTLDGRRLADWPFADYLFGHALPSYAKVFISYQAMAAERPGTVSILPHHQLAERPAETLVAMLAHLSAKPRQWPAIDDAVDLARREHRVAIEAELGRPLDRARRRRHRQGPEVREEPMREQLDPGVHREALEYLASLGLDLRYFRSAADVGASSSTRFGTA